MTAHEASRTPSEIDAIAEAWVDTELDLFPEFRVYLGRPGREGEYADYSPAGAEQALAETKKTLAAITAATPVDDVDEVTKMDLARELQLHIDKHEAGFRERDLNVIASPPQDLRMIFDLVPTETNEDWSNIAKRMHNLPAALAGYVETLRAGIAKGNVPAVRQVREVMDQVAKHSAKDGFFFELAGSAKDVPASLASDLEAGAAASAQAYDDLVTFLRDELQSHAPEKDAVGRELDRKSVV